MDIKEIIKNNPSHLSTHYSTRLNAYISFDGDNTYIWSDGWIDAKPQPEEELIAFNGNDIALDVVYFDLNIENQEDAQEWSDIQAMFKEKKIRVWDTDLTHGPAHENKSVKALREYLANGKTDFILSSDCLFEDQLNTYPVEGVSENGYRLFDANVYRYLNRSIKRGYYIRNIDELRAVRRKFVKCGYCGNQEEAGTEFCTKCLGSQYLKESDLKLVRMQKIGSRGPKIAELTATELKIIKPMYDRAQTKARRERNAKKRIEIMNTRVNVIAHANRECEGLLWFIDNGFDVSNIIYYKHTSTFCFGWRTAYSEEQAKEIRDELTRLECGWTFEIKTA